MTSTADVAEVVHVKCPGHCPGVTARFDEIHFYFQGICILISDPLSIFVSEWNFPDIVVASYPSFSWIHQSKTDLVVGHETLCVSDVSRFATAQVFDNVGMKVIILWVTQRVGSSIEWCPNNEFITRAAELFP